MASTASSSARPDAAQAREAGPLPRKIGEFGYRPPAEPEAERDADGAPSDLQDVDIADRHPADTQWPAAASTTSLPSTASAAHTAAHSTTRLARRAAAAPMPPKSYTFWDRLTSIYAPPLYGGMHGPSLTRTLFIMLLAGGTIAGWVLTVEHINAQNASAGSGDGSSDGETVVQMTGAMFIFVHIAFAVGLLLELVFLERAVFQLRAERWRFLHPGERREFGSGGMGLAPWNRPPLPTYAAALGIRGTGDVEDDAIAVPPPPEYGNTRGSTLLLASLMPSILRRGSARSARLVQVPESRPVSYRETDEEAEGISDAIRARQLELALSRLEEGGLPAERS